MLLPIIRAITSTCYSKTEQIVVVPLNKNNGPFKIGGFFAHTGYEDNKEEFSQFELFKIIARSKLELDLLLLLIGHLCDRAHTSFKLIHLMNTS